MPDTKLPVAILCDSVTVCPTCFGRTVAPAAPIRYFHAVFAVPLPRYKYLHGSKATRPFWHFPILRRMQVDPSLLVYDIDSFTTTAVRARCACIFHSPFGPRPFMILFGRATPTVLLSSQSHFFQWVYSRTFVNVPATRLATACHELADMLLQLVV